MKSKAYDGGEFSTLVGRPLFGRTTKVLTKHQLTY